MNSDFIREFLEQGKYHNLSQSDQSKGLPQPPPELPYDVTQRQFELPAPTALALDPINPRELIEERVTVRRYTDQPLSLEELSYLLWCTQGVKPLGLANITKRTVPSAGARHPFETVLLVNNVEGLPPGLYRYLASAHMLLLLSTDENLAETFTRACLGQNHVRESAVTFGWVAVSERTTWRYCERGIRYMLIDAGHVCQNLYLAAWAIGCGVCAIGAFNDDEINDILDLDGADRFMIYLGTVGKRVKG